jgi:hypothetical protein
LFCFFTVSDPDPSFKFLFEYKRKNNSCFEESKYLSGALEASLGAGKLFVEL